MARRRWWGVLVFVMAAVLTMSACSDDGNESKTGGEGSPVTITHALGTAVIPDHPTRVVTLGAADTQIASVLGADIVGAVKNPAAENGNWPAVDPPLSAEVAALDSVAPNVEQIAALAPDLILATTAQSGYAEVYDRLSELAPTVVYFNAPLQDSGEELLTQIGMALGESEAADELRRSSDQAVEAFVTKHPGLAGKRIAFGQFAGGTTYLVADPNTQSARFFTALGLRLPPELEAMAGGEGSTAAMGMVTPSAESLGVLNDADLGLISVFGAEPATFTSIPTVATSSLATSGQLYTIPVDLAAALLQPNPATTKYTLAALQGYTQAFTR